MHTFATHLRENVTPTRAFSSAGSEHLPYKQRVGGSNPSTPTENQRLTRNRESFLFLFPPIFRWFSKSDLNQDLNRKNIMNTAVNGVCYKSKTLKNGEYPIMLRICKQGKEYS